MSFLNVSQWPVNNLAITNADGHTTPWFNIADAKGMQFFSKWTGAATVTVTADLSPCTANTNGADNKAPGDFFENVAVFSTATVTFQWHDPPGELDRPVQSIRLVIATSADITAAHIGFTKNGVGP